MADSVPSEPSNNRGRNSRGRGGRGGNRPRDGEEQGQSGEGKRGGNRNRGRGGRGGNRSRGDDSRLDQQSAPPSANEAGNAMAPGKARMLGAHVDGQNGDKTQEEGEDLEAEVCFICASPVVHNSVAPCNHRTCHICSLRLRALYKTKACAHCRVSAALTHTRTTYRAEC